MYKAKQKREYVDVADTNQNNNTGAEQFVTLLNNKIYNRVEESSVAPAQQQSVSTATARTLYNSSRYEPNHYDPYYALYDEDSELYRDVGKLTHAK